MAAVVLAKLLRAGEGKMVRRLSNIADHIETLEVDYVDLTDAELRALTDTFKERYGDGETLDDLLPEAFAVVREAARRTLGQFHYKVQLMGGTALAPGQHRRDENGRGQDARVDAAGVSQRAQRRRRPRRHRQRLSRRAATPTGWAACIASSACRSARSCRSCRPRSAGPRTPATSPTAPTTSSASTTFATTWPGRSTIWCSAATTSPSSTRSTRSSSTRPAPR